MDELRFQRLEDKVDHVKDDVTELKVTLNMGMQKLDTHMVKIDEHVAGDAKIITEISPVIEKLPELVEILEEYKFEKNLKLKKKEKITDLTKRAGMITAVCGAALAVLKVLQVF